MTDPREVRMTTTDREVERVWRPGEDEIMSAAFAGLVSFALRQPQMIAAFEAESGLHYVAPRTGLEHMIDDATGASGDYVRRFILWVEKTQWGEPMPPAFRADFDLTAQERDKA